MQEKLLAKVICFKPNTYLNKPPQMTRLEWGGGGGSSATHPQCELELERGSFEERSAGVITGGSKAVRTLLPYVHTVD